MTQIIDSNLIRTKFHLLNTPSAYTATYESFFGTLSEQVNVMTVFSKIEDKQNHIKKHHLLPGGRKCQDPFTVGFISIGAADTSA